MCVYVCINPSVSERGCIIKTKSTISNTTLYIYMTLYICNNYINHSYEDYEVIIIIIIQS